MKVIAKLNYLRMSPRKVRLVANLIKGMDIEEAEHQLKFLSKRSARSLLKLLDSAISNAEHNFNLAKTNLYINSILVDGGPTLKRFMPRARGMASPIAKRTSHITLVLEEKEPGRQKIKRVKKQAFKKEERAEEKKPERAEYKEKPRAPKEEKIPAKMPTFAKKVFRRKSI